ncbi:hypothetical protein ACN28I_30875 [Archangium gephyra]|uniref:hypothetical protein n=1 Tax=Archangium gephyra TaxID=48 RepID=UPI003B7BF619
MSLAEDNPAPMAAIQRALELLDREALPKWLPSLLDAPPPYREPWPSMCQATTVQSPPR